jgi:hypothetical protein
LHYDLILPQRQLSELGIELDDPGKESQKEAVDHGCSKTENDRSNSNSDSNHDDKI